MSLLLLFGDARAVPPTIVSQTLLADGVTVRCIFDQALTAGDAVGLTRSVGTITSASVVAGNLDIVVPKAYAGDAIGTLTYDGTGTLAGATGSVAAFGPVAITNNGPAWTPAELPGIIDYMIWSDLTRLFQNSDGTGAVASVDDPIGYMRGQLDVLTYRQATAGNKPKLGANGIDFSGYGSQRYLAGDTVYLPSNAEVVSAGVWAGLAYNRSGQTLVPEFSGSGTGHFLKTFSLTHLSCAVRGTSTLIADAAPYVPATYILSTDGTTADLYKNGEYSTSPTVGSATSNFYAYYIGGFSSASNTPSPWCAAIMCHGAGSHVDAATAIKIHNWLADQ